MSVEIYWVPATTPNGLLAGCSRGAARFRRFAVAPASFTPQPIMTLRRSISSLLLAAFIAMPARAQLTAPSAPTAPVDSFALRALRWRLIGPFRSGRSVAVAGSLKRPLEYYAGTTGGGVMKT